MNPIRFSLAALLLVVTVMASFLAIPLLRGLLGIITAVAVVLALLIAAQWPIVWLLDRGKTGAARDEEPSGKE